MSSTNKTSNYELSQFVGTDKPAWLSDYNGDMSRIDTGIHNAQTTATGADGKADANSTSIGTLANLTTTAKNNLVAAVNEVKGNATTAQNSADSVGVVANRADQGVNDIKTYFTFTQTGTTSVSITGGSIAAQDLKYASNAAGSLGKLYGRIVYNSNAATQTLTFNTPFRPAANMNIDGVVLMFNATNNIQSVESISLATDGKATLNITAASGSTVRLLVPACVLFIEDFGD